MSTGSVIAISVLLLCLAVVECAPTLGGVKLQYREDLVPREAPLEYQEVSEQSLENGRFFEGDLAISPEVIATRYDRHASIATAGIRDRTLRWPEGKVIYELDTSLSPKTISHIQQAMDWWNEATCIKFVRRTNQQDYIHIQSTNSGCYSDFVGHLGSEQVLNLQEYGCSKVGTIVHELGHHMGLWHEQSRYDRDKYIKVIKENMKTENKVNFEKYSKDLLDTQGLAYDYDSVMHYSANSFSKNGKDTIVVINRRVYADQGSPTIGQRDHLSKGDIAVINRLYNCPAARDDY